MSSKKGFANISRTGKSIGTSSGLNSFLINKDDEEVNKKRNPLKKEKKNIKEPKRETKPKETPVKASKSEKEVAGPEKNTFQDQQPKNKKVSLDFIIRHDFKAHSVLVSKSQLNELRNLVNFKKWKENPKFSIQLVLFEALSMLMNDRIKQNNFPDDFAPYSISISQEQWNELDSFVVKVSNLDYTKYGKKYAVYEAISMYLNKHPINP